MILIFFRNVMGASGKKSRHAWPLPAPSRYPRLKANLLIPSLI